MSFIEDDHSKRETPGPIPNPEVKPFVLGVLVSKRSKASKLSSLIYF